MVVGKIIKKVDPSVTAPSPKDGSTGDVSFLDYIINILESREWVENVKSFIEFQDNLSYQIGLLLTYLFNNKFIIAFCYIIGSLIVYFFIYKKFLKRNSIKETFVALKNWELHSFSVSLFFF
jgi:hypothetical protein